MTGRQETGEVYHVTVLLMTGRQVRRIIDGSQLISLLLFNDFLFYPDPVAADSPLLTLLSNLNKRDVRNLLRTTRADLEKRAQDPFFNLLR